MNPDFAPMFVSLEERQEFTEALLSHRRAAALSNHNEVHAPADDLSARR